MIIFFYKLPQRLKFMIHAIHWFILMECKHLLLKIVSMIVLLHNNIVSTKTHNNFICRVTKTQFTNYKSFCWIFFKGQQSKIMEYMFTGSNRTTII
jgi:hypothetical protein